MRTCPVADDAWTPLENAIRHHFLPSLTGRKAFSDCERRLLALPPRLGEMGVAIPHELAKQQYASSKEVPKDLVVLIEAQDPVYTNEVRDSQMATIKELKKKKKEEQVLADTLSKESPKDIQLAINLAKEKGASTWLTVLPIEEFGYCLHKSAFRDAISLRYGWKPEGMPTTCVCGKAFSVEHAMSCKCGGLIINRHNEIRDITADLMSEVSSNVEVEPQLQPLTGEMMSQRSAVQSDEARLDIKADGFWGIRGQCTFFDVKVFNPYAPSNRTSTVQKCYIRHEREKRRSYEERIREVELSTFTPIVFSTSGGAGPAATVMMRRLASLIAEKKGLSFSIIMNWIRSRFSFSLIRSTIACIRGSRYKYSHKKQHDPEITVIESRLDIDE